MLSVNIIGGKLYEILDDEIWRKIFVSFVASNNVTPSSTAVADKGDVADDDEDDIMEVPVTSGDNRKRNASNDEVCEIVEMPPTKKPKFDEVGHVQERHLMASVP